MKKFKIKSFCKINLSLRVLKKLNNGYHNINSLITFCNVHDIVTISETLGKKDNISFSGKFKKGISLKSNTITKALYQLRKKNFLGKKIFKINIKKNIPQGAGLGGGSGDAAILLNFLNQKMNLKISKNELKKIALKIGSDVPVYLEKKNTFLTGKTGDLLRLNNKFNLNILIIYPNIVCSTKKIYKSNKVFTLARPQHNFNKKNKKQLLFYLMNEKNDLEKTVVKFYPKVGKIIEILKSQNDCLFSRITGSGSACIGVFSNMRAAILTQKLINLKFPKYWSVISKTM